MRKNLFFLAVIMLLLTMTACNKQKKTGGDEEAKGDSVATAVTDTVKPAEVEYTKTDLTAFGLVGHVKKVVTLSYAAHPQGDKLVSDGPQEGSDNQLMTFGEDGVVTLDAFGNPYVYDKDGKFVEGRSKVSKMERDAKNRIVSYENRESQNHWEGYNYEFTYDEAGRIVKYNYVGWEEIFEYTYTFDGDNLYPSSQLMEGQATADLFKYETFYRYTRFDDEGNWLEREVWENQQEGVEDGSDNPSMESTKVYRIEKREITYY